MAGPGATNYVMINNFLIDCSISENHVFDSEITDYPVESGSNISDNIRPLPIQVEIEGLVSNTPIGIMKDIRGLTSTFGSLVLSNKPADDAYELFMVIRDAREPVTIQTSLRTYENMGLQSLSIPKGDHQDALRFQARFKQIISVENKRSIRVSTPIGSHGKGVTKPGDPYAGRNILIDRELNQWWDPDYNVWRDRAKYLEVREENTGSTTVTAKWHLWRYGTHKATVHKGAIVSLIPEESAVQINSFDKESWRRFTAKDFKDVITVPLTFCVLHDFIIKRTFTAPTDLEPLPNSLHNRHF